MIHETDFDTTPPPGSDAGRGMSSSIAQPCWMALDAARDRAFTGEIVFDAEPALRVYLDNGVAYYAERADDPTLGQRLVAAGVVNPAQLERGTVRVGGVEHLGRLFDRDPSVDRDAVMVVTEEATQALLADIANNVIATSRAIAYRHHESGVHRWFVAPPPSAHMPRPVGDVALVDNSVVENLPGLPSAEVGSVSDELRIEWDEPLLPIEPLPAAGEGADLLAELYDDEFSMIVEPRLAVPPPPVERREPSPPDAAERETADVCDDVVQQSVDRSDDRVDLAPDPIDDGADDVRFEEVAFAEWSVEFGEGAESASATNEVSSLPSLSEPPAVPPAVPSVSVPLSVPPLLVPPAVPPAMTPLSVPDFTLPDVTDPAVVPPPPTGVESLVLDLDALSTPNDIDDADPAEALAHAEVIVPLDEFHIVWPDGTQDAPTVPLTDVPSHSLDDPFRGDSDSIVGEVLLGRNGHRWPVDVDDADVAPPHAPAIAEPTAAPDDEMVWPGEGGGVVTDASSDDEMVWPGEGGGVVTDASLGGEPAADLFTGMAGSVDDRAVDDRPVEADVALDLGGTLGVTVAAAEVWAGVADALPAESPAAGSGDDGSGDDGSVDEGPAEISMVESPPGFSAEGRIDVHVADDGWSGEAARAPDDSFGDARSWSPDVAPRDWGQAGSSIGALALGDTDLTAALDAPGVPELARSDGEPSGAAEHRLEADHSPAAGHVGLDFELPPLVLGELPGEAARVPDEVSDAVLRAIRAIENASLAAASVSPIIGTEPAPKVDDPRAFQGFAPPRLATSAEVMYAPAVAEPPPAIEAVTGPVLEHEPALEARTDEPRVASVVFVDDDAPADRPEDRAGALRRLIGSLRRR